MNYSPSECPVCTYNRNFLGAKNCELCGTPLAEVASLAAVGSYKQSSQPLNRSIDASVVTLARKAAAQMQHHLSKTRSEKPLQEITAESNPSVEQNSQTKLFAAKQQQDAQGSALYSDPWSSDSSEFDSPTSDILQRNLVYRSNSSSVIQKTDKQIKRILKTVTSAGFWRGRSNALFINRLILSKTSVIAKILLISAVIFGTGSIATILINNRYSREKISVTPKEEPPSKYSDIDLYDNMEAVPNVPEGLFSYGGALCFAALQRDGMNTAISRVHPSFRLRYVEPKFSNPGCTTGIRMLIDGELSIAQNSRALTEAEITEARARGYELESVPVAIDGIVFYTDKSLGIKSLSLEQVRDIYLGKIRNWKQVGGKDLLVTPIGLDPKIDSILRLLMKTKSTPLIGKNVVIARDYTTAIRQTSSTPGAISYASSAILKGQRSITPIALSANSDSPPVSALLADGMVNLQAFEKNVYPLTRRLFIVIRRDGTPQEKAGVAYTNLLLSKEGQRIFKQAGFVPLY